MTVRVVATRETSSGVELLSADVDALPELLADPEVVVWVDIDAQDDEAQRVLRDIFDFHPLVIEDAFADATTPKVEDFGDYLYLIVHGLSDADPTDGEVQTADLDIFFGERFVITHYRLHFAAVEQTRREVEKDPTILAQGAAVIAHRVIDRLVDEFLPLMERLDGEADRIEDMILADSSPKLLERIFLMKHSLQRIRRVALHQQALLLKLADGSFDLVPDDIRPFFRDVYDHMVRVTDLNDVYRELMGSALDAYLGVQSHKLNEVMRVLTVFSTVMLPLTFITGLYGMNFDHMPGLHWEYAYETAWAVMIGISIGMLVFFRRRRWI